MLGGACLVVECGFPAALAFIGLYVGAIVGDGIIYRLGAAAHRSRALQKCCAGSI